MDWIIGIIFLIIKLGLVLIGLLLVAAYLVLVERKFLARLQIRYGPNRAGKFGLLQPIADTVKMMVKEISYRRRQTARYFCWPRQWWHSPPF